MQNSNQPKPKGGNKWYAAEVLSNAPPPLASFKVGGGAFVKRSEDGPGVIVFDPTSKAVAALSTEIAGDTLHLHGAAQAQFQDVLNDKFAKVQPAQSKTEGDPTNEQISHAPQGHPQPRYVYHARAHHPQDDRGTENRISR